MPLLSHDEISAIYTKALEMGFQTQRDTLLSSVSTAFVALLPINNRPAAQLLLDLNNLNDQEETIGNDLPFDRWLQQAALLSGVKDGQFFADMAEKAARAAAVGADSGGGGGDGTLRERIIFRNEMLRIVFLTLALHTARAVGRLVVPQVEGGAPRRNPSSGQPLTGYATAWLIGVRHAMTNLHAVRARGQGEADPSDADLQLQAAGAGIEFDYDAMGAAPPAAARVKELVHADPGLDYAVLALAEASDRQPLTLRGEAIVVDEGQPFPVNIIQHPGALPKHITMRNNLVASVRGRDLTYFADTDGGSSGAPVCDDVWRVVALHREASRRFGRLDFQGKDTAWVNVGTPIALIVADLKEKAPTLWAEIAARLG